MLKTIGKPVAPIDSVDLLVECHGRIRGFLAMARRLGSAPDADAASIRDAAAEVHRYFAEALPLHARDEEESVLPRLRGRAPSVDAELELMVQEHREHESAMGVLVDTCGRLAEDPSRHGELGPAVASASAELERHFADHLWREEGVIFPAMRRLFDRATDAAIAGEIRQRRADAVRPTPWRRTSAGPLANPGTR